jgi:hypothetical protein
MKSYDTVDEIDKLSRREVLSFTLGMAGLALLGGRSALAQVSPHSFVDRLALERRADRDPTLRPPLLVDMQTHVWWCADGPRTLTPRGEHFLKTLAGSRAAVLGRAVPIADMGRVMFFEDVFLESQTDIAFLNSFGMKAAFDGVDLFPPREAAFIRSMAPARIRVLGTVDPPDGASAVESLIYQCEELQSEYVTSSTVDNIRSIESQTLSGISVIKVFLQPGANVDGAIAQLASISQTSCGSCPPARNHPLSCAITPRACLFSR